MSLGLVLPLYCTEVNSVGRPWLLLLYHSSEVSLLSRDDILVAVCSR